MLVVPTLFTLPNHPLNPRDLCLPVPVPVQCQDALCWGCGTNPAKCKRCNNYTYKDVTILLDKRSGRCVPPRCSVNNCRLCRDGRPRQCAYCKAGYTASESGACVPRKPAAKAD